MKQKMLRVLAIVAVLTLMLGMLSGCTQNKVRGTISRFEDACQALDVKGMLECMNPTIAKPILGAMEFLGIEDTSGALDALVKALGIFENAGEKTEEFIKSIKISPSSYTFNADKDKCTVEATISYGENESSEVAIDMVLKDENWYISLIGF